MALWRARLCGSLSIQHSGLVYKSEQALIAYLCFGLSISPTSLKGQSREFAFGQRFRWNYHCYVKCRCDWAFRGQLWWTIGQRVCLIPLTSSSLSGRAMGLVLNHFKAEYRTKENLDQHSVADVACLLLFSLLLMKVRQFLLCHWTGYSSHLILYLFDGAIYTRWWNDLMTIYDMQPYWLNMLHSVEANY